MEGCRFEPGKLARPSAATIAWMECRDKGQRTWATASPESVCYGLKIHTSSFFPAELAIYPQASTAQKAGGGGAAPDPRRSTGTQAGRGGQVPSPGFLWFPPPKDSPDQQWWPKVPDTWMLSDFWLSLQNTRSVTNVNYCAQFCLIDSALIYVMKNMLVIIKVNTSSKSKEYYLTMTSVFNIHLFFIL